jgi:hypothetical protein
VKIRFPNPQVIISPSMRNVNVEWGSRYLRHKRDFGTSLHETKKLTATDVRQPPLVPPAASPSKFRAHKFEDRTRFGNLHTERPKLKTLINAYIDIEYPPENSGQSPQLLQISLVIG